jgi:hypothetical protein
MSGNRTAEYEDNSLHQLARPQCPGQTQLDVVEKVFLTIILTFTSVVFK